MELVGIGHKFHKTCNLNLFRAFGCVMARHAHQVQDTLANQGTRGKGTLWAWHEQQLWFKDYSFYLTQETFCNALRLILIQGEHGRPAVDPLTASELTQCRVSQWRPSGELSNQLPSMQRALECYPLHYQKVLSKSWSQWIHMDDSITTSESVMLGMANAHTGVEMLRVQYRTDDQSRCYPTRVPHQSGRCVRSLQGDGSLPQEFVSERKQQKLGRQRHLEEAVWHFRAIFQPRSKVRKDFMVVHHAALFDPLEPVSIDSGPIWARRHMSQSGEKVASDWFAMVFWSLEQMAISTLNLTPAVKYTWTHIPQQIHKQQTWTYKHLIRIILQQVHIQKTRLRSYSREHHQLWEAHQFLHCRAMKMIISAWLFLYKSIKWISKVRYSRVVIFAREIGIPVPHADLNLHMLEEAHNCYPQPFRWSSPIVPQKGLLIAKFKHTKTTVWNQKQLVTLPQRTMYIQFISPTDQCLPTQTKATTYECRPDTFPTWR